MTVNWTPLHAALGLEPGPLTVDHLRTACEQELRERDDLDWKARLPKEREEKKGFAKDVAAMANTRGGLIVYGVSEVRKTGAAASLSSVDNSEVAHQTLRQVAASQIRPFLAGLQFLSLSSNDGITLLAVVVPASSDAPHFIGNPDEFRVPHRDGDTTRSMNEFEIARAYERRSRGYEDERQSLSRLITGVRDSLSLPTDAWIVGAALPRMSMWQAQGAHLDAQGVRSLLAAAANLSLQLVPEDGADSTLLTRVLESAARDSVGLRRRVVATPTSRTQSKSSTAHAEVLHDGSVVFASALEGWYPRVVEGRHQVLRGIVERFAVDLVALSFVAGSRAGGATPIAVGVEVCFGTVWSAVFVQPRWVGSIVAGYERAVGARELRGLAPAWVELPPDAGKAQLMASARQVALDIINQFGVEDLWLIPSDDRAPAEPDVGEPPE